LFGHLMRFITWQAANWKKETISCEENWVTTFKHLNEQNIPLPNLVTVTVCLLFAWNTSTCRMCILNYEQWLVTWHNWLDESTLLQTELPFEMQEVSWASTTVTVAIMRYHTRRPMHCHHFRSIVHTCLSSDHFWFIHQSSGNYQQIHIVSQYSVWLRNERQRDRGSIPGREKRIFPLALQALGPTQGTRVPFLGVKYGRRVKLTTHPHLLPSSWMSRSCTSSPPPLRLQG
jgi:hypothetical protein